MHEPPDEPAEASESRPSRASAEEAARYAEAIVETVRHPLLVLNGDLIVETANPAFYRCFEVDPEETRGRRLYDLGNGQWDIPELRRLLEEVLREVRSVEDYRVEHEFEQIGKRVMLLNANRMERGGGRDDRILLAIADITEREHLLWELEGQKEYSEKIVDAVRNPLLVLGWDLRVKTANQRFYDTFQVKPEETQGRLVYELGNSQWDIPRLRELLEHVLPENNSFDDFEVEHDFQEIGHRVMLLNARMIDHKQWILLAIEDVTDRRRTETQQQATLGESHHRVKNILMNVATLARQTLQASATLEEFGAAFQSRLDALGRSQDMLMRSDDGADLHKVVCLELQALGAEEDRHFTVDGPPLRLPARAAQSMAMVVHELGTNAGKYGALAADGGWIEIAWRSEPGKGGGHLSFHWRERGVEIDPGAVGRGFGTQLIESSVRFGLGGTVDLTFHPDGLECVIDCPLPRA
jgi:two-component sensor histidine kinase/PAS domain-containing protein